MVKSLLCRFLLGKKYLNYYLNSNTCVKIFDVIKFLTDFMKNTTYFDIELK